MITQICAVYDAKAAAFGTPFFTQSLGQAERSFTDEVNRDDDGKNVMFNHAEDFQLFHLGSYNDENAEFDPVFPPRLLVSGAAVKR